ncbi:hypothetical protein BCR33DRAFT_857161 [Rhizoclosmatium globosum]|uniref:Uncharacterized protein n=1 Tax=Rhizoclosmatium globosum TaxID=329046 RepID=A0A1Y2B8P9_9FUNG|nr:hypothetical protein BCR33DRAFT_857161 [Rhizoclosmatium globosum]|eukprot:ORY30900.1 hypothetical protein BCR33DRAFT_857161 [Rhizoclosmatium globosum]
MLQTHHPTRLLSLPPTLIASIVLHLPIDQSLVFLGRTSKLFLHLVHLKPAFARKHFLFRWTQSRIPSLLLFLASFGISGSVFRALSLCYQGVVLEAVLSTSEENVHRGSIGDPNRWILPDSRALKVALQMVQNGFVAAIRSSRSIRFAAINNQSSVVRYLGGLSGVDASACANQAIQSACEFGHGNVVRALLEDARVDPACLNNVCIRIAALNGSLDVVCVLLADARVDPSALGSYAVTAACIKGHTEILRRLLLDGRVFPSENCLVAACIYGHILIVQALLFDPRVVAGDGMNGQQKVLGAACAHNQVHIVMILLGLPSPCGIYPPARNNYIIKEASRKGHWRIVQMLFMDHRVDLAICTLEMNMLLYRHLYHLETMIMHAESNGSEEERENLMLLHHSLTGKILNDCDAYFTRLGLVMRL